MLLDIEKILGLIDEVASSQQGLADEEALILRGCIDFLRFPMTMC